jgi:hypothetical protein
MMMNWKGLGRKWSWPKISKENTTWETKTQIVGMLTRLEICIV